MKAVHFARLSSALCLATVPAAVAGARGVSDPAPIISAFNETCRRGFPDLETIRQGAESRGWIRQSVRMIGERSDRKLRKAPLPDFFQKGDMTLILSAPYKRWTNSSCTVWVLAEKTLDTHGLAAAVSAALNGAQASLAKERGVERATWQVKPGMAVKASVIQSGGIRTANLAIITD
jgi:hypothetical protein